MSTREFRSSPPRGRGSTAWRIDRQATSGGDRSIERGARGLLLAAVLCFLSGSGLSVAGSLVLHLKFDDGPGSSVAADSSGNGLDGTLVNMDPNADWVAGMSGYALDFDGVDDLVRVDDDPALDFGSCDFTVSYWFFKASTTENFDNVYGVNKWSTGASPGINEWSLHLGHGLTQEDRPKFGVEIGTTSYFAVSPNVIDLRQWHHIAGTRQGGTLRLYVDGVLEAESRSLPPDASVNNSGRHLRVAVNQPPAPLLYTDAIFDDIQVYDFAQSDGGVSVGEAAGSDIAYLFDNPGLSLPAAAAGSVPDGVGVAGAPVEISLEPGGDVTLSWDASCLATDTDYAIYEGTLGDFSSHTPLMCSTGGSTSMSFTPGPGNTYYLIVPSNGSREGSYGKDSDGAERPPALTACLPRAIGCCSP